MKKTFYVVALIVAAWLAINTNGPIPPQSRPGSDEWLSYLSQHYFDILDGQGTVLIPATWNGWAPLKKGKDSHPQQ
ncbi:hypothetical protein [uncultured Paraburkholderia sp.]|uniref:hypothetical protein n=1 Tax=uncultured Paraburkholderia sp. TaxID=1822466 RepID=UPI0025925893|nr:hypothetical protein [uncultured Paraburkholderia sp.]